MLVGFDVARRVGTHVNVVDHPGQHRVPAMGEPALECELHQLLARRAHVFEALPERDDGEAHVLQVLAHLDCAPPVEGDLADIEACAELLDEVLDVGVVDHVALRGLQEALGLPQVVGHVIARHPQRQVVLGDPEPRDDPVLLVVPVGWEDEDERSDICC